MKENSRQNIAGAELCDLSLTVEAVFILMARRTLRIAKLLGSDLKEILEEYEPNVLGYCLQSSYSRLHMVIALTCHLPTLASESKVSLA